MMLNAIEEARGALAKKHRVAAANLNYVGEWDTGFRGRRFWLFNILRPGHPLHRSTVVMERETGGEQRP